MDTYHAAFWSDPCYTSSSDEEEICCYSSKLLPFKNDATVFLRTLNAAEMFRYPSPDLCLDTILSRSSMYSFDLMAWVLLWLSTVGHYIDRCVPLQIMSNQLNLPLQSSCRNISRMINGNRMHLSSISSLIANGLNTYVNELFLFFICNNNLILLCRYGVLCVDWGGLLFLINFRIML